MQPRSFIGNYQSMKYFTYIFFVANCFLISTDAWSQNAKLWTLEDCIAYALEQNISVKRNVFSNQSLSEMYEQAKAQRLPSVNASVSQNFNWSRMTSTSDLSGTTNSAYSVNSGVTVFNGARINNQIRQSKLDIDAGKYDLETTKESVSLNILSAFLQVLYAEEQVRNSEKQIESTSQQVNLALERLNLKVISQADYAQVKSQFASEKLNLANAINQLAISRVNLMQLMELPVSDSFKIASPPSENLINEQRKPDVQSIFEKALSIKPQIKSAEINKEIASLDEKIARAGYIPILSASAGLSTVALYNLYSNNDESSPYFDQLNDRLNPSAGLSLSIPVYQRRQAKTSLALARINYQNAELNETDTRNQLRKNIEQACQDVISAQTEYEASLENYNATRESSALSNEKFNQGLINSVDYLVSKTTLILAESKLLQSKYNLIFSYKILDFYTEVPLTL